MKRLLIAALALLTIASADPVADTRAIMAGTVTTKSVKSAYLSGARDTTAAFKGALSAYKAVRAAEVPPVPVPAPVPTPVPTPTPTPTLAAYDTSIGVGVDANGYANLPLRSGAHRYYVSSATGSNVNSCSAAQLPSTPKATMAAGMACVVAGNGDQVLVAEGTTYSETLPNLDERAGNSAAYPTVIQSYAPTDPTNETKLGRATSGHRPIVNTAAAFQNITCCTNTPASYLAIRGFDINPGNVADMELRFIGSAGHGSNSYVLIENNIFRFTLLTIDQPEAVHDVIRKNAFYGAWSTGGHAQGSYSAGITGLTIEDNVYWHNGWKVGVTREEPEATGGPTIFNQAIYAQTSTASLIRRNIIIDPSAGGCSCRGDTTILENVLIDNPLGIIAGKGDDYDVHRPSGVAIEVGYNAILGDADIRSTLPRGNAITNGNGKPGSRIHHNLIARSRSPGAVNVAFSTDAEFNQPSYAAIDHNVEYKWAFAGRVALKGGSFPAQDFPTYDANAWSDPASGTNTNAASAVLPNPLTGAQLFVALGCIDKATCTARMIESPEAGWAVKARAILWQGYGMPN